MLESVQIIQAAARGTAADWRAATRRVDCLEARTVAEALRREGVPFARAFGAAARQLRSGLKVKEDGARLVRIFSVRHALGALVAVVVRVCLQRGLADAPAWQALAAADRWALLGGATAGLIVPFVARRSTPRLWSEDRGLVARWIRAYAGGLRGIRGVRPDAGPDPWEADLIVLERRELLSGVDHGAERRDRLDAWARARLGEARRSVDRLADLLPFYELCGIGLPAALILATPLVAVMRGV